MKQKRLLLIDTCGDTAGVAVSVGRDVLAAEDFPRGGASAVIIAAVRRLLVQVGWGLADLDAVGVVSGPGSFTGMRIGLAAAKGLCEAAGVHLVGVSRLAVLADASDAKGSLVALDAGRGQVYVRDVVSGHEWLSADAEVGGCAGMVVAEEPVAGRLKACEPVVRQLRVSDALGVVLWQLHQSEDAGAPVEANYVRAEQDIYRQVGASVDTVKMGAD